MKHSGTVNLNRKETNESKRILDTIIMRTPMMPPSTPREVLYIETGLLNIETLNKRKTMDMQAGLKRSPNQERDLIITSNIKNG